MPRLWVTIVNNELAEQAMKRGRNAALMCAALFAFLAAHAWWDHKGEGVGAIVFAALFLFAAWRIHRGSADLMDLAMIWLPVGVGVCWHAITQLGESWLVPLLFVFFGFDLLNGVRGASYLHAPLGLRRRGDGGEPGEVGASPRPNLPLHPPDARMPTEV